MHWARAFFDKWLTGISPGRCARSTSSISITFFRNAIATSLKFLGARATPRGTRFMKLVEASQL